MNDVAGDEKAVESLPFLGSAGEIACLLIDSLKRYTVRNFTGWGREIVESHRITNCRTRAVYGIVVCTGNVYFSTGDQIGMVIISRSRGSTGYRCSKLSKRWGLEIIN